MEGGSAGDGCSRSLLVSFCTRILCSSVNNVRTTFRLLQPDSIFKHASALWCVFSPCATLCAGIQILDITISPSRHLLRACAVMLSFFGMHCEITNATCRSSSNGHTGSTGDSFTPVRVSKSSLSVHRSDGSKCMNVRQAAVVHTVDCITPAAACSVVALLGRNDSDQAYVAVNHHKICSQL